MLKYYVVTHCVNTRVVFSRIVPATKSMLHKLCLCKLFNALYKLVKYVLRYLCETFDQILLNSLVMKDKIAVVFAVVFVIVCLTS